VRRAKARTMFGRRHRDVLFMGLPVARDTVDHESLAVTRVPSPRQGRIVHCFRSNTRAAAATRLSGTLNGTAMWARRRRHGPVANVRFLDTSISQLMAGLGRLLPLAADIAGSAAKCPAIRGGTV
jgi:hypothetical protein